MNTGNPNRRNNHKGGAPKGVPRVTSNYDRTWQQLGSILEPTQDELREFLGEEAFGMYQAWKERKNALPDSALKSYDEASAELERAGDDAHARLAAARTMLASLREMYQSAIGKRKRALAASAGGAQ